MNVKMMSKTRSTFVRDYKYLPVDSVVPPHTPPFKKKNPLPFHDNELFKIIFKYIK